MLYLTLLSSCIMEHEPCESNLECWQEFGAGFACTNEIEGEQSDVKDDFHYCTRVEDTRCELWVDANEYFFDDREFNIQELTQDEKLSDLITIISGQEEQYDWKLKYDEIRTINEETPVNLLVCEPDAMSFAVDNYGSHLMIVTKSVLQNYDLTSQFSVLGDENTEGKAHLFVADVDKFGLSLSESEISNSENSSTIFDNNMKGLIPFAQKNRVWYGVGSLDQKIAYLFDDENEIGDGTVPLSFDTSVYVHDKEHSEELLKSSGLDDDWVVYYDESTQDVNSLEFLERDYIIADYLGTDFLDKLKINSFDGHLIFHDITDVQLEEIIAHVNSESNVNSEGNSNAVQYSIQVITDKCDGGGDNNIVDYNDITLKMFYVAKILMRMDNVSYTSLSNQVDESMMKTEMGNMLRKLTSTSQDARPLSADFAINITSESISSPTSFFADNDYYLQFESTSMKFNNNKERQLCLELQPPLVVGSAQ